MEKSINGILVRGDRSGNDALQTSTMDVKSKTGLFEKIWDPSMESHEEEEGWLDRFIPFTGRSEFQTQLKEQARKMVNQGNIGGCSMATLLNMIQLQKMYAKHPEKLGHVHCTFSTSVGNPQNADRGYGDRTFVTHGDMARLLRTYENITQERANRVVRRRWEAL